MGTTRPAVCFMVLQVASRSPCMPGKTSTTELHHQLKGRTFQMLPTLPGKKRGGGTKFALLLT